MKENFGRKLLLIQGIVQGVGFRPFVYNLAQKIGLTGFVQNSLYGVEIEIEGRLQDLETFIAILPNKIPSLATIDNITIQDIQCLQDKVFYIKDSSTISFSMIPVDIGICSQCEAELFDKNNRRYKYPFINCVACGPRYSIISQLPYDRKQTSMVEFKMCKECEKEYNDPQNRRYHAQPISCFDCGPQLDNTMEDILETLSNGGSVALKGIGGFHLLCDATSFNAIANLRLKKRRATKPFALMFAGIEELQHYFYISAYEKKLLTSKEKPIVILSQTSKRKLPDNIAPHISRFGVFLAYTPLHLLLLKAFQKPLVVTSANISEMPIITQENSLKKDLLHIVDNTLSHNREILNGADDSVIAMVGDSSHIFYRLARGYSPKNFYMEHQTRKHILALGANQKVTLTIVLQNYMVISAHIGDLNSLESIEYFEKNLSSLMKIYNFKPEILVCDKHPSYETSKWAKKYQAKNPETKILFLQHHYAHILSVMGEYKLDEEVLGFSFDGTGYGDDGTLWGGEVFLASTTAYRRIAHLQNITLLGGEKAIKEPKRVALAMLFEVFSKDIDTHFLGYSENEKQIFYKMYENKLNAPSSSSMGRLFDGVYALLGFLDHLGYEGESGLLLEELARNVETQESYTMSLENGVIMYSELLKELLDDDMPIEFKAKKFLNSVANIIEKIAQQYSDKKVVVSGGVFQNTTLLVSLKDRIKDIYIPTKIPSNDGGISFGQAYFAYMKEKK